MRSCYLWEEWLRASQQSVPRASGVLCASQPILSLRLHGHGDPHALLPTHPTPAGAPCRLQLHLFAFVGNSALHPPGLDPGLAREQVSSVSKGKLPVLPSLPQMLFLTLSALDFSHCILRVLVLCGFKGNGAGGLHGSQLSCS